MWMIENLSIKNKLSVDKSRIRVELYFIQTISITKYSSGECEQEPDIRSTNKPVVRSRKRFTQQLLPEFWGSGHTRQRRQTMANRDEILANFQVKWGFILLVVDYLGKEMIVEDLLIINHMFIIILYAFRTGFTSELFVDGLFYFCFGLFVWLVYGLVELFWSCCVVEVVYIHLASRRRDSSRIVV